MRFRRRRNRSVEHASAVTLQASFIGKSGGTMDSPKPLRTAVVGCGLQGHTLAQAILRTQSLRLVACADPDEAAASRTAGLAQNVSTHSSVEALLAECEVDVVLVATPHHLLAPITLAALRAGKHVMAEKPIALN